MAEKVLFVIDYQKDFVDGALPCGPKAKAIENELYDYIVKRMKEGWLVVFTMDTHNHEYDKTTEAKKFPIHCKVGTDGWPLYGKIDEFDNPNNYIIEKNSVMAYDWFGFFDELWDDGYLGFDAFEVCGLDIAYCVFQNALALASLYNNVPVTVNLDMSATFNPALARFCVDYMKSCGIQIVGDLEGN